MINTLNKPTYSISDMYSDMIDKTRQNNKFKFQMSQILNTTNRSIKNNNINDAKMQINMILSCIDVDNLDNPFSIDFYRVLEFVDRKLSDDNFTSKYHLINIISNLAKTFE